MPTFKGVYMRLVECYVQNFGTLSGYTAEFNRGLTATLAENGSGKTTLAAFIKAMLYGLNTERKQSLDDNERKRYLPWQGGRYGGSLTIEVDGVYYRIERSFGAKASDDSFRLVNAKTGEESDAFSENIGYELFDIDAAGFERTVFISEKNIKGAISNDSISAKLSDLVGTTGDVGAVGAAISRLEERRKYYQKRGNQGEITVIRARIAECDAAIDNLERKRTLAEEKEGELRRIADEIAALDAEIARLELELAAERRGREQRGYREQYAVMQRELAKTKESLDELSLFFKEGIPTSSEIDDARDARREAERLMATRTDTESERYAELCDFFRRPTDAHELSLMEICSTEAKAARDEADAIEKNLRFTEETLADDFGGRIPDIAVLDSHISRLKSGSFPILSLLFSLGTVIFAALAILFSYLFFIPTVICLALSASVFLIEKKKSENAIRYCEALGIKEKPAEALTAIRERVAQHIAVSERDRERLAELTAKASENEAKLSLFVAGYPHGKDDIHEAFEHISALFGELFAQKARSKSNESARAELNLRIQFFSDKYKAFADKYPTVTEDPFEEIRGKLNSYNYLRMLMSKKADECASFRAVHGIDENEALPTDDAPGDTSLIEASLARHRDRIITRRRDHVILEREYAALLSDVERIDEVMAAREQLSDKLARYNENLEVVVSTISMLNEASLAMTARYIGGTKERLEKYIGAIDKSVEDIALSTDFVLKIFDKGETRAEESYSRGMRDLYAFALRLALSDSLYGGRAPFFLMDDPFTALDGERLARAKALVKELAGERQIIYFTCSAERMI